MDDSAAALVVGGTAEIISLAGYRELNQRRARRERALNIGLGMLLCSLQAIILLLSGGFARPWLAAATLAICALLSLLLALSPSPTRAWARSPAYAEAERRISR